jgi:hypothetical protein
MFTACASAAALPTEVPPNFITSVGWWWLLWRSCCCFVSAINCLHIISE